MFPLLDWLNGPMSGTFNDFLLKDKHIPSLSIFFFVRPHLFAPMVAWHKTYAWVVPVEGCTCLSQVFLLQPGLSLPVVPLIHLHLPSSILHLVTNEEHQIKPSCRFILRRLIMVDFFPPVANIRAIVFSEHQKSISIARKWTLPGPECNVITASITSCVCPCPWWYWRS